jgi:hypothetical protein
MTMQARESTASVRVNIWEYCQPPKVNGGYNGMAETRTNLERRIGAKEARLGYMLA